MAEPKDDPDEARFVQKVVNHLGNSHLEEDLNDFFELHSEELRYELSCSLPPAVIRGEAEGEYSVRVHELYQRFLVVVQANLAEFLDAEGMTEAELRDACEREMRLEGSGGLNFMHTLISSWEFASFVALASDYVTEEDDDEEGVAYGHDDRRPAALESVSLCAGDCSSNAGCRPSDLDDSRDASVGTRVSDDFEQYGCKEGCKEALGTSAVSPLTKRSRDYPQGTATDQLQNFGQVRDSERLGEGKVREDWDAGSWRSEPSRVAQEKL